MCYLWLDNMMDGPFYSLFHLLCCSKLYFPFPGCFYLKHPFLCDMVIHQGGGSNAQRLSRGWRETYKSHQSFCISSSHCHPACALLKKTKTTYNMQTLTVQHAALHSSFDSVAFPFLTLPMTSEGEVVRLIIIFTVMRRGRGAGYSTNKSWKSL